MVDTDQVVDIETYDKHKQLAIYQQIADIETQVQPIDGWSVASIEQTLQTPSNHVLVIMYGTQVACYCLYSQIFETAEILRIGTSPSWQRQGLASQLIDVLKKQLSTAKVEQLLLEVREDNTKAIKLYQKNGFNVIHRRKGYYKNDTQIKNPQTDKSAVDALIMQCMLHI